MERESFENEETAALMNELFVNVKVDREERPDVDKARRVPVAPTWGGRCGKRALQNARAGWSVHAWQAMCGLAGVVRLPLQCVRAWVCVQQACA